MMTILFIFALLASGYLFWQGHIIAGIFMFLSSLVAWAFSND